MTRLQLLTAVCGLLALGMASAESPLQFNDPWSPLAPPGRTMAGFMTIDNTGENDIALVDATSPQFGRIELHTMTMDEGVMRMRRLEELMVAAGESVTLEPGGKHLMLFEPAVQFEDGDTLDVELIDSDGGRHDVVLRVRPRE